MAPYNIVLYFVKKLNRMDYKIQMRSLHFESGFEGLKMKIRETIVFMK
mgnify:CR=1 FL=1